MACLALFGVSWVIGGLIVRAVLGVVWRELPRTLRLGLGWASGAAFSGMSTFWAIVLAPHQRGAAVAFAAFAGLSLIFVHLAQNPLDRVLPSTRAGRWERIGWWIGAAGFLAVLALWTGRGLHLGVGSPAGGWDAFSIWNQRARFFYLCPDEWTRAFDPVLDWSHPEYPNLVPSLIVYGWLPEGRCLALAPVTVALLTQIGKLLLLVGFTQAAYPRSVWPWVFGVFYATIRQEWTQEVAWQYADRPLAVFLLAGIGCLALAHRQRGRSWYLLAGLFWGAAGFCKDEGKAALVVVCAGVVLATLWAIGRARGREALRNAGLLSLGLVPGLGSWALQWAYSPVPTKLIALMTTDPLRDTSRTTLILDFLVNRLNHPEWGGMWWGCGLALLTLAPWLKRLELWLLWLFPAVQLMIYLVIFQLTPQPLAWHLDSAMPRLLFQIGPIVFLAASWLILEANETAGGSRPS